METEIFFECSNCLNSFSIKMQSINFDSSRELIFNPEPVCPRCGAIEEIVLSDYGLEQIDNMIFSNKIKTIIK